MGFCASDLRPRRFRSDRMKAGRVLRRGGSAAAAAFRCSSVLAHSSNHASTRRRWPEVQEKARFFFLSFGRRGQRLIVVGLTRPGKKFMRNLLPNHSKLVKALMRVLNAREQDSLFRICRKLRTGNPVRFFAEIMHEDND